MREAGRGGIGGTSIGALPIGVLTNGLVIMRVCSYRQQVVIGVIIVAAWLSTPLRSRGAE